MWRTRDKGSQRARDEEDQEGTRRLSGTEKAVGLDMTEITMAVNPLCSRYSSYEEGLGSRSGGDGGGDGEPSDDGQFDDPAHDGYDHDADSAPTTHGRRTTLPSALLRSREGTTQSAYDALVLGMHDVTCCDKARSVTQAFTALACGAALNFSLGLAPLADVAAANPTANWVFILVYFGVFPALYAHCLLVLSNVTISFSVAPMRSRWYQVLVPLVTGIASMVLYMCTAGALGEFPVPLAFISFIGNITVVNLPAVALVMFRARHSGNKPPISCGMVCAAAVGMLAGWSLAIAYIHFFARQTAPLQNLMLVGLHIWKLTAIFMLDFLHEAQAHKVGDMPITRAVGAAGVHWFWMLYENIVFVTVKEPSTFALFLALDLSQTLLAASFCSFTVQRIILKTKRNVARAACLAETAARVDAELANPDVVRQYVYSDALQFYIMQVGEIFLAAYAAVFLAVHRFSPVNAAHYTLADVSDDHVFRAMTFSSIACAAEAAMFPVACLLVRCCTRQHIDVLAIAAAVNKQPWRISKGHLWAVLLGVCAIPLNLLVLKHARLEGFEFFPLAAAAVVNATNGAPADGAAWNQTWTQANATAHATGGFL